MYLLDIVLHDLTTLEILMLEYTNTMIHEYKTIYNHAFHNSRSSRIVFTYIYASISAPLSCLLILPGTMLSCLLMLINIS